VHPTINSFLFCALCFGAALTSDHNVTLDLPAYVFSESFQFWFLQIVTIVVSVRFHSADLSDEPVKSIFHVNAVRCRCLVKRTVEFPGESDTVHCRNYAFVEQVELVCDDYKRDFLEVS